MTEHTDNTIAAYDEHAIWETGRTAEEALARFYQATQADPEEGSPLYTAPMTQRLADHIEAQGFDANHDSYNILPDGTLDISED
jgi:hypothetical protein